jgi:hypothetical protein
MSLNLQIDDASGQDQGHKANLLSLPPETLHQILELLIDPPNVISLNKLPPKFDLVEAIGPLSQICRALRAGSLSWYASAKARLNLTKTTKYGHIDLHTRNFTLLINNSRSHRLPHGPNNLIWYDVGAHCLMNVCPCQILGDVLGEWNVRDFAPIRELTVKMMGPDRRWERNWFNDDFARFLRKNATSVEELDVYFQWDISPTTWHCL